HRQGALRRRELDGHRRGRAQGAGRCDRRIDGPHRGRQGHAAQPARAAPELGESRYTMAENITSVIETEDLIKARYPLLYVVSSEEQRVEDSLKEMALRRELKLAAWSITKGFVKLHGMIKGGDVKDPIKALDFIAAGEGKGIYVLRDFHAFVG